MSRGIRAELVLTLAVQVQIQDSLNMRMECWSDADLKMLFLLLRIPQEVPRKASTYALHNTVSHKRRA